MELVKLISHAIGCHFVLLTVSFALQKLFSFMRSLLLVIYLSTYTVGGMLRKWSPVPMHSNLFPIFSSIRFSVAGLMLRSLVVQNDSYQFICILLHAYSHLVQHHLLKICFGFLWFFVCLFCIACNFGFFVKNQVCIDVWIYFWFFSLISLINMSFFASAMKFFITIAV